MEGLFHETANCTNNKRITCAGLQAYSSARGNFDRSFRKRIRSFKCREIFLLVKDKAPDIGLATVYRTLELLSELSIVDKINFGDGVSRYDLRKEGVNHFHHHLVCMECGSVEEVMDDLLGDVEKIVED